MTTTLGKLPEFCPDAGNIDVYIERFELFVNANGIDAIKKLQVFLTVLGEKAYVTLRNLQLPKTPTQVKYEEAVAVLRQHYAPKRWIVTERYRFYRRNQESSESIAQFIVELKRLAMTCSFGSFLEEALRDRLIAGLRTDSIRCRLLALPGNEITWERVCNIATAMEAAQKDTRDMLSNAATASASAKQHTTKPRTSGSERTAWKKGQAKKRETETVRACHRCGGKHAPVSCPFLKSNCYKCSKPGQVAKLCKTKVVHQVHENLSEKDLLFVVRTTMEVRPP
ncbi:unnamed protein product [Ixodes persulcatus]